MEEEQNREEVGIDKGGEKRGESKQVGENNWKDTGDREGKERSKQGKGDEEKMKRAGGKEETKRGNE